MISKTKLYARPLGSKPAARISKNIEIAARIVAVALCNLTSFKPAFIRSIPGSAIISLRKPSTIASSFHRDERRVSAVIPRSAAINAGAIETTSKGIQSKIIRVGLASGWNGATTPARAVNAISKPTALRVISKDGRQANFPYFTRCSSANLYSAKRDRK